MILKKREKTLATVAAALVVVILGSQLYSTWQGPRSRLRAQHQNLTNDVKRKQAQVKESQAAVARLAGWNRRALPADPERARSLYHAWLGKLVDEVGFRGQRRVETGDGRRRSGIYRGLRFTVQAEATLKRLIEFLYKFYSAGHLHQIRTVTIRPIEGSDDLKVTIAVEALSLPGAKHKDQLSEEPAERLALASVDEYHDAIGQRNVFAAYKPLPPPRDETPRGPEFDPGKYAYLTGIVGVNDVRTACLLERATGKLSELLEGDTFEVGQLRGKVLHINRRDAEIEIDGQRWLFPIGDNLRQIVKLPGGGEG